MLTNLVTAASLLSLIPSTWNLNVEVDFCVLDDSGHAVSNAIVKAYTRRDRIDAMGGHGVSPQREVVVVTDVNGCATARFPCYSGEFSARIHAENFYDERIGGVQFKRADDGIVVEHLLEHEKHVPVTLRRIVNPIPMFRNCPGYFLKIPAQEGCFGFDVMDNDWTTPHGRGRKADFEVEYRCSTTNGNRRSAGAIIFREDGSGAYRMKKMPFSYCSVYHADTNAVYCQKIEFAREVSATDFVQKADVLGDDEYLVLRTRVKADARGSVVSANYSKIYGPFVIDGILYFPEAFFNPTPNDTNLEFDETRNLAPRRRR